MNIAEKLRCTGQIAHPIGITEEGDEEYSAATTIECYAYGAKNKVVTVNEKSVTLSYFLVLLPTTTVHMLSKITNVVDVAGSKLFDEARVASIQDAVHPRKGVLGRVVGVGRW